VASSSLLQQLQKGMQAAFAINSALLEADAASNALRDNEPGKPTPSDRIHSACLDEAVIANRSLR